MFSNRISAVKKRRKKEKFLWQNFVAKRFATPIFSKKHRFFDVAKRFATKFATKISPVFLLFSNNVFQSNFCGQKKGVKKENICGKSFVAKRFATSFATSFRLTIGS